MSEGRLGDYLEVLIDHRGKTPKKLGGDFVERGVPVASAVNIKDGRLDLGDDPRCVTTTMYRQWMAVSVRRGDVLLTSEAPLGEVARVPFDGPLVLGQRLFGLRGREGILDTGYLYYLLQWSPVRNQLEARSTGTTAHGIRQSELVEVQIPLRPFAEQRAIAEVLGALDDKLQANRQLVGLCSAVFQSSWALAASGAYRKEFGEIADLDKGLSYKGSGLGSGSPLVNLGNFGTDGLFHPEEIKRYSGESRDRHWVDRGDLVLANTDLTQRREILGQPALVEIDEPRALFTHHVYAVRVRNPGLDHLWLYAALREQDFRDRAMSFATGTTVAALPRDAVLTYDLPWPETDVRSTWTATAVSIVARWDAARRENRELEALRDAVLPKLLSGELLVRDSETLVG